MRVSGLMFKPEANLETHQTSLREIWMCNDHCNNVTLSLLMIIEQLNIIISTLISMYPQQTHHYASSCVGLDGGPILLCR